MKDIIFLTQHQKQILDEENVGVKTLTLKALRDYVTATDYQSILNQTITLQQRGNLLYKLGFGIQPTENGVENAIRSESVAVDIYSSEAAEYTALQIDQTQLNAACPNADTIVIWKEPSTANDMLRQSMYNILTAMSTVLAFEEVKHCVQFERCILQNI